MSDIFDPPSAANFRDELEALINRHNKENDSNTPDFILAEYLINCLNAFTKCSRRREEWYGKSLSINEPENIGSRGGEDTPTIPPITGGA